MTSTRRSWSQHPVEGRRLMVEKGGPVERSALERGPSTRSTRPCLNLVVIVRSLSAACIHNRESFSSLCLATQHRNVLEEKKKETRRIRVSSLKALLHLAIHIEATGRRRKKSSNSHSSSSSRRSRSRIRAYVRIGVELGEAGFRYALCVRAYVRTYVRACE